MKREEAAGSLIGLAPLSAVLSFLRTEGPAYALITTRAGEYAADWTVQEMPPIQRSLVKKTPPWLRGRILLRLARALVRSSYKAAEYFIQNVLDVKRKQNDGRVS